MQKKNRFTKYCHHFFLIVLLSGAFILFPQSLKAETKLALVISNSQYDYGTFQHTINETAKNAEQVVKVLKKLCFEVTLKTNLSRRGMKAAINEFVTDLTPVYEYEDSKPIGLFYFAGYGAQTKEQQFLLPIKNDEINSQIDLEFDAISMRQIIRKMARANSQNIIILDACYEKPYDGNDAQSLCHNLASLTKKSLFLPNQTNFIIGYSHVDNLKRGQKNIFTPTLIKILEQMVRQSTDIKQMFKQVRADVMYKSGGKQIPRDIWHHLENFSLGGVRKCTRGNKAPLELCSCCSWAGCFPCPCRFE